MLTVVTLAVTAAVAVGVGYADPPPDVRRYTLAECLAAAEQSYPGLRAAEHKILASHAQVDEAWLAPLFPITATGFLSYAGEGLGNPTYSPDAFGQNPFAGSYSYFAQLQLNTGVPLSPWTWVRLGRVRDAARQDLRVSEEELTKSRLELRANVRKAYYGLLFAQDAHYLLDQGQGFLDQAQRQVETGLDAGEESYSQIDLLRLGVPQGDIEGRRADADAGEHNARRALGALTGLGDVVDVVDQPLCPAVEDLHPLHFYLTRAEVNRPDVHMLAAGVEARRAARDIQFWSYFPDIALGLTAAMSSAPTIADQPNPFAANASNYAFWGAGLALHWTFEPLTNAARVRRLSQQLSMTEEQQRLALGAIGLEVGEVWERADSARRRMTAYTHAETSAYGVLTALFQQYQAGGGELGAVLIPLQQYIQMRFNKLQAVFDLDKALADMAVSTGTDEVAGDPSAGCEARAVTGPAATPGGGTPDENDEAINALLQEVSDAGVDAATRAVPTPELVDGGVRRRPATRR